MVCNIKSNYVSAFEHARLMAEAEGTEHLVGRVQQLESEVVAILSIVQIALAALPPGDPVREDLEEMRMAAQLAVHQ